MAADLSHQRIEFGIAHLDRIAMAAAAIDE
jgi:hypothetical protein